MGAVPPRDDVLADDPEWILSERTGWHSRGRWPHQGSSTLTPLSRPTIGWLQPGPREQSLDRLVQELHYPVSSTRNAPFQHWLHNSARRHHAW